MAHVVSRRLILRNAALASAAVALRSFAQEPAARTWVYVGCYTTRGQGIYIYEMNAASGALSLVRVVGSPMETPNPSFLALSPHGRFLYSVNEVGNYEGRQSGSVTAFSVNQTSGDLTRLNAQPTEGRNPAHLSVDATGRFVIAANYSGTTMGTNNVTLLPIGADGRLEAPAQLVTHTGDLGPNTGRQEAPHAHMAMPDPTGQYILVNDLGLDRTFIYRLDRAEAKLVLVGEPSGALPGSGPRHLAFHPNGKFLFVLNELASTVSAWTWDAERGAANRIQTISTLPEWYRGVNTTAQILVSADGRFVYASNRGHNSIAVFSVNPDTGMLTYVAEQWTFGQTPRNYNIDPSGNFLYVGHQDSDNLVTFKIDKVTGKLEFTGQQLLTPGQPVCIIFLSTAQLAGNTVKPGVTFWSPNNPALLDRNGRTQTTLAWNAPEATEVEIRIGAPDGVNMGRQANYGTATTSGWVTEGAAFHLQDVSGGKPLTAANTLGMVRIQARR